MLREKPKTRKCLIIENSHRKRVDKEGPSSAYSPRDSKTQRREGSSIKNSHIIANVKRFPCKTRQQTNIWCIPAVVEAAMKYLDPTAVVDQKNLVEEYVKTKEFMTISYESLKDNVLIPKFGSRFCFFIEVHPEFEE